VVFCEYHAHCEERAEQEPGWFDRIWVIGGIGIQHISSLDQLPRTDWCYRFICTECEMERIEEYDLRVVPTSGGKADPNFNNTKINKLSSS
jgi:hypothetical protein